MTLSIERARSRRPVTWITLIGVMLLPVLIGGILVAALYNPVERLDRISAAIVNEDDPVTLNGQTVPLGRQLTAGLVEGSDDQPSNIDWTITNADDAAAGLGDGTYLAVVTIPENFSATATSSGQVLSGEDATAEQAVIDVHTSPDALVVDDAITATVTTAAASVMGSTLSGTTLENVFIGYSTLGDSLQDASSGANDLNDGLAQSADGAAALPAAVGQSQQGAVALASGATQLQSGLGTIASNIGLSANGARTIADNIDAAAAGVQSQQVKDLANASTLAAARATEQTGAVALALGNPSDGLAQTLGALAADCTASGGTPDFCAQLGAAATDAGTIAQNAAGATQAGKDSAVAAGTVDYAVRELMNQTSSGLGALSGAQRQLASGLDQLATGTTQSADAAGQLATGGTQLADGLGEIQTGTQQLSDGLDQLASGSEQLASGLDQAAASVPVLSDEESKNVADVIADPVTTEGLSDNLFGASAIPLLVAVILWFGGLATFVVLQAVSGHALSSRQPSVWLALRALLPAAAIGAVQGLSLAVLVQITTGYDWGDWSVFALVCVVAGVSFAAVNQALVAVFGGAGRWISALIGSLAVATGIVSTFPPVLQTLAGLVPTSPGYTALLASVTAADGEAAGIVGLVVWAALAFVVTTIAVARRRTLSPRALLASPAPA